MNFYELNEKIMNEPRMSARPGLSGGKTVRRKRKPGNRPGGRIDRSNLGYSRKKDRFDYQDLDVNEDSDKDWRVRGSNYDNPSRDQFPTMLNDVLDKKFSAVDKKIFNMIAYNNSGRMNDWWLEFKQDPIEWIMKKKEDWQARGLWNKTADLIQSEQRNEDHSEMSDDDYKITPSGHLGGKVSVSDSFGRPKEFQEVEDALDYIRKDMEKNHFWPNIWWISDHGNHWMIDLEGKEIKENADDMLASKQMSAKPLKNKSRLTPSQLIQQYKDRKFYADYVQKFSLADEDEHKRKKIEAGEKYEAKRKGKNLGRPKGATMGRNTRYSGKQGWGTTDQPDKFRTKDQDLDESKTIMNFYELNKIMNNEATETKEELQKRLIRLQDEQREAEDAGNMEKADRLHQQIERLYNMNRPGVDASGPGWQ